MEQLTYDIAKALLNTGKEITAVSVAGPEIYLGVGSTAYTERKDAERLLSPAAYQKALTHPENANPLYVHLTGRALSSMLRKSAFYYSTEEED